MARVKSRKKIQDKDVLLRTINEEDIKTFRDIRSNTLFTICECVIRGNRDVREISIIVNNGDEQIITEHDIMNKSISPIAGAIAVGTLYRTYEKERKQNVLPK